MSKFIECKIVGEIKRSVKLYDGKEYHLPNYKEFFGVYIEPNTFLLNIDSIVSANIEKHILAHCFDVKVKRNILLRILGFKDITKQELREDGTYSACRLVISTGDRHEIIYTSEDVYDLIEQEKVVKK